MRKPWLHMGCFALWLVGLVLIVGGLRDQPPPVPAGDGWLRLETWDHGLAQVCLYEGQRLKYGQLVPSTMEMITVREAFDPERLVKATDPDAPDVLPVMKMNLLRSTRTGTYEYRQMASVFVHRDTAALHKLVATSQEWCGGSFVELERRGDEATLRISNYFPGEGSSARSIPTAELPITADELPLFLRQRLTQLEVGDSFRLAAPLLSHKPRYTVGTAEVVALDTGSETLTDGSVRAVRTVVLETPWGRESWAFADDALRTLIVWSNEAGEEYRLRKDMFLDYWNRNQPGDEALLDGGSR